MTFWHWVSYFCMSSKGKVTEKIRETKMALVQEFSTPLSRQCHQDEIAMFQNELTSCHKVPRRLWHDEEHRSTIKFISETTEQMAGKNGGSNNLVQNSTSSYNVFCSSTVGWLTHIWVSHHHQIQHLPWPPGLDDEAKPLLLDDPCQGLRQAQAGYQEKESPCRTFMAKVRVFDTAVFRDGRVESPTSTQVG